MKVLDRIKALLAGDDDDQAVVATDQAISSATEASPEAEFKRRLRSGGFSDSYLALLGLVASLTVEAAEDSPSASRLSTSDQGERHAYYRGLQTSLACLAMHETGSNPRQVALLVTQHVKDLIRCRWANGHGAGASG